MTGPDILTEAVVKVLQEMLDEQGRSNLPYNYDEDDYADIDFNAVARAIKAEIRNAVPVRTSPSNSADEYFMGGVDGFNEACRLILGEEE